MNHKQDAGRAAGAVTAQYDFCPITSEGENLFSVRAGIPLNDAFNQLSMLLTSSVESIELLACEEEVDSIPNALWQSAHLLSFSLALVQAIHQGHNAAKDQARALNAAPTKSRRA